MTGSGQTRTPVGICAMCFGRKPITHGWAWLKLCADCALIQKAPLRPPEPAEDEGGGMDDPPTGEARPDRRSPDSRDGD